MAQDFPLIILGGNGFTGHYLLKLMTERGLKAEIVSRRDMQLPANLTHIKIDLNKAQDWVIPPRSTVISLLPLWLLANYLPQLKGVKTIIATGSTSLFAKAQSGEAYERSVAELLQNAESILKEWSHKNDVTWTILRPTTIYDCEKDHNILRMAQFIKRWHFFPLAIPAKGMRQPIHAEDVAKALLGALSNSDATNRSFNIAGGEVLPYRAMTERIFIALGLKPRILFLPAGFLMTIFRLATKLGLLKEKSFGASIFQRMNDDLLFDVGEGMDILKYQPRPFNPQFSGQIVSALPQ